MSRKEWMRKYGGYSYEEFVDELIEDLERDPYASGFSMPGWTFDNSDKPQKCEYLIDNDSYDNWRVTPLIKPKSADVAESKVKRTRKRKVDNPAPDAEKLIQNPHPSATTPKGKKKSTSSEGVKKGSKRSRKSPPAATKKIE